MDIQVKLERQIENYARIHGLPSSLVRTAATRENSSSSPLTAQEMLRLCSLCCPIILEYNYADDYPGGEDWRDKRFLSAFTIGRLSLVPNSQIVAWKSQNAPVNLHQRDRQSTINPLTPEARAAAPDDCRVL